MSGINGAQSVVDEALKLSEVAEKIARIRGTPTDVDPSLFKHFAIASGAIGMPGSSTPIQTLLLSVPNGMDVLITSIWVRIVDGPNKVIADDLLDITGGGSPRVGTLQLKKNGTSLTPSGVGYLALANRPVLFLLTSGDVISVVLQFFSGVVVETAISGFLVPTIASVGRWFAGMQTTVPTSNIIQQGSSGSGVQTAATTTPF